MATVVVGFVSDYTARHWGRRKIWYLVGSIVVTITFPVSFIPYLIQYDGSRIMNLLCHGTFYLLIVRSVLLTLLHFSIFVPFTFLAFSWCVERPHSQTPYSLHTRSTHPPPPRLSRRSSFPPPHEDTAFPPAFLLAFPLLKLLCSVPASQLGSRQR